MRKSLVEFRKEVNPYLVLFMLILVFLPFSIRIPNILIAITSVYWLIFEKSKKPQHPKRLTILLLLFIPYIVGITYSTDVSEGLFGLEKRLPLLAFPLIFSSVVLSEKQHIYLYITFILTTLSAAIYCVGFEVINHYNRYDGLYPINFDYFKLSELTQGIELPPPYFGLYIGFTLILTSFLFQRQEISLSTFLAVSIFLGAFILLSGARTAIFALAISLFIFWFIKKKTKAILVSVVIAISATAVLVKDDVLQNRFKDALTLTTNSDTSSHSSLSLRLAEWTSAMSVIKEHPFLGVGTGDYQVALNKSYLLHGVYEAYENEYNAHNQYLEITVALGLIGLFCLLLNFKLGISIAIKNENWVYLSLLILLLICFLTESMLERQKGIVLLAFFHSLFAYSSSQLNRS